MEPEIRAKVDKGLIEPGFTPEMVYLALGIPKDYFTASFAAARVFGWLAHIVEQRKDNRIIRPSAHYTGPAPREA